MRLLTFRYGGKSCNMSLCLYLKLEIQNGLDLTILWRHYILQVIYFGNADFCLSCVDFE